MKGQIDSDALRELAYSFGRSGKLLRLLEKEYQFQEKMVLALAKDVEDLPEGEQNDAHNNIRKWIRRRICFWCKNYYRHQGSMGEVHKKSVREK